VARENSFLEKSINHIDSRVKRSSRVLFVARAGAWASIKGFRDLFKIKEFPNGTGDGSSGISKWGPIDEPAALDC
jgi:hypothetical protein